MKISKMKKIFILSLSALGLGAATAIPIIIMSKKNKNQTTKKNIVVNNNDLQELSTKQIANDYKDKLMNSFKSLVISKLETKPLIKINSTSGTLQENKDVIINAIKNSYYFVFPPAGFDIKLKSNQNQEITLSETRVDIEIFKINNQNALASIENFFQVKRSQTVSEFENSNYEKIKNHFSNENNKNIGIPFESASKTYAQLTQEEVLKAVKKALVFNGSIFWTKTLLDKISLKDNSENRAITNFNNKKTITIEYGPNGSKSEVDLKIWKYSIRKTIPKYFRNKNNKFITIPFNVASSSDANSILEKVKNVLLRRNNELWQNLKNYLFVSSTNKLLTLEKGTDDSFAYKYFAITYGPEAKESERKKITLKVRHFSIAQQIKNYFSNQQNKMINIFASNSLLNTANKILDAIKVNLNIKNNSIWTKELHDSIKISPSNKTTSLVKGDFPKPFIIEYTNGPSKESIILKVKHLQN